MSHRPAALIRSLLAFAMMMAALSTLALGSATAQGDRGLVDETSYQSPQFGYAVTWSEPWEARDRDVLTNPGGFDTITLRSLDGVVRISGRADTYDPLTFLQDTIAIQLASGAEVTNMDTTATVPTAELQIAQDRMRLDVVSLPEAGAVVLVSLRANELDYDVALESAQSGIQLAGAPLFGAAGAPATEAAQPTETVTQPTEPAQPTQAAPTQPVTQPTEAAQPTEPITQPTQTAPTEAVAPTVAAPTSTQEVLGGGLQGNTFSSPNFDFSISWDDTVWTAPEDALYTEPDFEVLSLESDTGPLWVSGWRGYEGSASTCLLGEQTFINDPEQGITDWQVAVDANGNELTGEEGNRAWGVFTSTYTDPEDPTAAPEPYVDYLECVSVGDGESVVIFHTYAPRQLYNDHIGKVTAVIETLELASAPASPEPVTTQPATVAPVGTEAATIPATTEPVATEAATEQPQETPAEAGTTTVPTDLTGGDGVTGEAFPYSFSVPAGWEVSESSLGGDVERTVLTNGTSTVAVEARAMQAPTLSECVTTVAAEHEGDPQYTGLALSRTASGDPFTGEDDFSAFANYTFTGADGASWAHFIECRWIVEGESALVVIQDVPEDQFGSERAARRQIQNSIEIGQ